MRNLILTFAIAFSITVNAQQKNYLVSPNAKANEYFKKANNNLSGNIEEIIADYTKAIENDPKFIMAYNNRAEVELDNNKFKEAHADYQKIMELDAVFAEKSEILRKIALCKYKLGNYNEALEAYNNFIKNYSKNCQNRPDRCCESYAGRGDVLFALNDYKNALNDYNIAILRCPQSYNIHNLRLNRAIINSQNNKYTEALDDIEKAIAVAPDDFINVLYYNRGVIKIASGDKDGGCTDLKKAIEMGNKEAYESLRNCSN